MVDDKNLYTQEEKEENYFKKKSTKELEKELKVFLCMDNNGGMLANDIIEELGKRTECELKKLKYFADIAHNILENSNNYKRSKNIISNIFKNQHEDYFNTVIFRLTVIDSYYSTQMNKRLFGIDDLAKRITEIGSSDDELISKCKEFIANTSIDNEIHKLFRNKYGISKTGNEVGQASSLISKYLYFLMDYEFPIFDSLAIKSYQKINLNKLSTLKDLDNKFHISYFDKLTELKNISGINSYNKLDNLLWLIGKIRRGSFSLIIERELYLDLINKSDLKNKIKIIKDIDTEKKVNTDEIIRNYIQSNIDSLSNIFKDNNLNEFIEFSLNYLDKPN